MTFALTCISRAVASNTYEIMLKPTEYLDRLLKCPFSILA